MTRINVAIRPKELPPNLLIAELRELIRIPNQINSGRYDMTNQPKVFKLGTGHVKFFYNKLGYLLDRYKKLRQEALDRNYNVQDFTSSWDNIPEEMMGNYTETLQDREILLGRFAERGHKIISL
jgi:deoxyribonuclease (pyrimidine dimer)